MISEHKTFKTASVAIPVILALATFGTSVLGQGAKVEGIIKTHNRSTITVQTSEQPKLVVVLSDSTDVVQVQGALKARVKKMSMSSLIPGLPVQVEGDYDGQNQLVATKIRFKGNDYDQARAIQAGVHQTEQQAAANQAELVKQNEALKQQQAALDEQHKKIAANKAAIAANSARFGQMDEYYILDEVTVLFANGKTSVDPSYVPKLVALCQKAKAYNGYMIQVKGYASATGSAAANQKLSKQRATNVSNIVTQDGNVPLTNMLAEGAMGASRQVGTDANTPQGEAANRRVVVRILQNKGIAGTEEAKAPGQ